MISVSMLVELLEDEELDEDELMQTVPCIVKPAGH